MPNHMPGDRVEVNIRGSWFRGTITENHHYPIEVSLDRPAQSHGMMVRTWFAKGFDLRPVLTGQSSPIPR